MKEYWVSYALTNGEECLVALPSFRKLLWWFLRTARRCNSISILTFRK